MKKPRKALLGRDHLGAPPPVKIAVGGAGRSNRQLWQAEPPASPGRRTNQIPVQSIIHHFSFFGNYLHSY
jgi:hypothetical protein